MADTGTIRIKVDLNDYLILGTQSKKFKGMYYIRFEDEYTGDLDNPRKPMYILELCRMKRKDELVSEYYKRTPLHRCWIVKPELKIQEYWTLNGLNLPNNFSHVETKEEVKRFMEMALKYS